MVFTSLLQRSWRPALAMAWLALVAAITLQPSTRSAREVAALGEMCLICGTRGSADAVLNLLLFLPLGFLVGSRGRSAGAGLLGGMVLSVVIEGTQLFVAGRHAGLADVVWNSAGSFVGVWAWRAAAARARTPDPRMSVVVSAMVVMALAVGGLLMTPRQTDADYWGQWTPDLGYMPRYDGRVVEASLSGTPFPSYRLAEEPPHRRLLSGDWRLEGAVVVGQPPPAVAPILSIYDGERTEIVLVGAHRTDLVYREHTLGRALRFDVPDVRVLGGLDGMEVGDTVRIVASRSPDLCLEIAGSRECGFGVTPGRTWGLLLYLEGPSERFRRGVDLFWLLALFSPIGYWAVGRRSWVVSSGIGLAGGALVVVVTPLVVPGWGEPLAALVGAVAGALAAWGVERIGAAPSRGAAAGSLPRSASPKS